MLLLSVFFVLSLTSCYSQQNGNSCFHQGAKQSGTCKPLSSCPAAIAQLQNRIYPQNCGSFIGSVPVVCCVSNNPVNAGSTTTTTARTTTATRTTTFRPVTTTFSGPLKVGDKCRLKCDEYSQYVYKLITPVVLLPGAPKQNISSCGFKAVPLIVGGEPAKPKEFPHMALIGFGEDTDVQWQCGGTMISEQFVLTAGHCLYHPELGDAKYVRIGDLILSSTADEVIPQEFKILERIKHPEYKPPSQYNDIALLKLDKGALLNEFVRPACVYTQPAIETNRAIASGWGKVDYAGVRSEDLLKVTLEFFTQEKCNQTYRTNINRRLKYGIVPESQVCAGSSNAQKDTCQGDSGGPLQIFDTQRYCMYYIVGVTSFGKACGIANSPGVYTRVSNYIEWIENTVWP